MKQLLAQQELLHPNLFNSLLAAIKPILSIDKCQLSLRVLSEFALKLVEKQPELYDEILASCQNDSKISSTGSSAIENDDDLNEIE